MTNPWKVLTRTKRGFDDDHCPQLAAAVAYHVMFSFIPLVTVLLAIFGVVMRDPQQQRVMVDHVLSVLPIQSETLVSDSIRNIASQRGALTGIGLVGLLWAAAGLFGAIRVALNVAWEVEAKRGFIADKVVDIGAVAGLGLLFIASLSGTMAIHFLQTLSANSPSANVPGSVQTLTVLGVMVPALFSFVAFLLVYRYVPNVRHGFGEVWFGALVATILFELAKHGFAIYVSHFNHYQAIYGALGGVMLFMLWTYLSAIIMLIGAECAATAEKQRGRPIEAEPSGRLQDLPRAVAR